MWNSNPPQYPELTEEEKAQAIWDRRKQKGQQLFSKAYAKNTKGERTFPTFTAKEFMEFIVKRGKARAEDLDWVDFIVNDDNKPVITLLSLYFTKDERFLSQKKGYSFRKGILLIGPMGVGKTNLLELCQVNPFASFIPSKCKDIVGEFSRERHGGQQVIDLYANDLFVENADDTFGHHFLGRSFDDLGQESIGKHYTWEANVMEQIIEKRYDSGNFYRTHATSNHTLDQFSDIYSPRVEDRCYEMFNVIQYPSTAKSFRRQ